MSWIISRVLPLLEMSSTISSGWKHTQVAVLSLARVEVYGGGAGRRECGGDIHRNLADLTHAGGHELAFCGGARVPTMASTAAS